MPPERDSATLLAWQRGFAAALHEPDRRDAASASPPPPDAYDAHARLGVYRNNSLQAFGAALALTYAVVERRVGADHFRRLAHAYRLAHPSRSGDLHAAGAAFPAWLQSQLAGTEYAWLADLARLEWAVEEAGTAAALTPVALTALAAIPPAALDDATLRLQPSLRLLSSSFPVWSVWQANQDAAASPVDAVGPEHCVCACTGERVVVYRLTADEYSVLEALARGATFAVALDATRTDSATLARVLGWAFAEGLVVAVSPCVPA